MTDADDQVEHTDEDYRVLIERRQALDELRISQITIADKSKLTLSGSTAAASLALLQWIAGRQEVECMNVLFLAWMGLLITIVCNLISYQTSEKDAETEIRAIDAEIRAGMRLPEPTNHYRKVTNQLNLWSLISFTISLVLIFIFAYANTQKAG